MYTRALYWLCEMVGAAWFESLLLWRRNKKNFHSRGSFKAKDETHATCLKEKVSQGGKVAQLSVQLSCKGGYIFRAPVVACFAVYLVVLSEHLCSVIVLVWGHVFADRWE